MHSPVSAHVETLLLIAIVQLIVIILSARLAGMAFRKLGQPQVCGEIAAGLILGPSLFGRYFPGTFHTVFDPSTAQIFSILSQIGLILLMFLIGLEFDFEHVNENRKTAAAISAAGILLPFALGYGLGHYIHDTLIGLGLLKAEISIVHFSLFMAAAMSITAIPILGRIMIELNINRTRIGALTISAAAIDDVVGWIILALVTAIVRAQFDALNTALMIAETLGYGLLMFTVVRPLVKKWVRRQLAGGGSEISLNALAFLLILILCSAAITNLIGIFSIFGAFIMGAILFDEHEFRVMVRHRLHDFVVVFFLPVFFTYTGLRTDMATMGGSGGTLWFLLGLVLAAACLGKFGGCTAAAMLNGLPWREAALIGVMMNTRALMELIVINMGYDLGIIPRSVFFMLVIMAVATTYVTTPILKRLIPGSEMARQDSKTELAFAADPAEY